MEIRRSSRALELRNLPIDGVDMFLITRLEGAVELAELISLVPGTPDEVMRRAHRLASLGLIETTGPEPLAWLALSAPQLEQDCDDEVLTVRPPKMASVDYDVMTTRPPSTSLDEMLTLRPPPPRSETQLRAAVPEVSVKRALEQVRAQGGRSPLHSMRSELRAEDDIPTSARRLLKR